MRVTTHLLATALVMNSWACGPTALKVASAKVAQAPSETENIEVNRATVPNDRDYVWHADFYKNAEIYCRNLMYMGQRSYVAYSWLGGATALVGTAGAAFGTAWAAGTPDDKKDTKLAGRVTLAVGSAVLGAFGLFMIKRAQAAATASGSAGTALGPKFDPDLGTVGVACAPALTPEECEASKRRKAETERWQACLEARAAWLGANAESLEVLAHRAEKAAEEKEEEKKEAEKKKVDKPAGFDAWVSGSCTTPDALDCVFCAGATINPAYVPYLASAYRAAAVATPSTGLQLCKLP